LGQLKGHNSEVPVGFWLDIEIGRDIMHTNILTKFDKDLMKSRCLREQKPCGRRPPARRRCSHKMNLKGMHVISFKISL